MHSAAGLWHLKGFSGDIAGIAETAAFMGAVNWDMLMDRFTVG
jgi:hypothetical protein